MSNIEIPNNSYIISPMPMRHNNINHTTEEQSDQTNQNSQTNQNTFYKFDVTGGFDETKYDETWGYDSKSDKVRTNNVQNDNVKITRAINYIDDKWWLKPNPETVNSIEYTDLNSAVDISFVLPPTIDYEVQIESKQISPSFVDYKPAKPAKENFSKEEELLNSIEQDIIKYNQSIIDNTEMVNLLSQKISFLKFRYGKNITYNKINLSCENLLDKSVIDSIKNTNMTIGSTDDEIKSQIDIVDLDIKNTINKINIDLKMLTDLKLQRITQMELVIKEKNKNLLYIEKNPPHILSGEELIRSYMLNEINNTNDEVGVKEITRHIEYTDTTNKMDALQSDRIYNLLDRKL